MRTFRALALVMLGAACASGATGNQAYREPGGPAHLSDSRFATEEECVRAMNNVQRIADRDTTVNPATKELFDPAERQDDLTHRIQRCTITLSQRQAACAELAGGPQQLKNCEIYQ